MKLWEVTVNQWGWDQPKTYYAASREEAEKIGREYPASSHVKYAGNFANDKAEWLLSGSWMTFTDWLLERSRSYSITFAYRIHNFKGNNVVFSFVPLKNEIVDEIVILPTKDFEIALDRYDIPFIREKGTHIPYDISLAKKNDNKTLIAQALRVDKSGNLERLQEWRAIAVIVSDVGPWHE